MSADRSDPIRTAVEALRASREALPENARGRWDYRARSVFMDGHDAGNIGVSGQPSVIANAHFAPGVGDYVTTVASPDVTEALEALLEALGRIGEPGTPIGSEFPAIVEARDALAAALARSTEGEQA